MSILQIKALFFRRCLHKQWENLKSAQKRVRIKTDSIKTHTLEFNKVNSYLQSFPQNSLKWREMCEPTKKKKCYHLKTLCIKRAFLNFWWTLWWHLSIAIFCYLRFCIRTTEKPGRHLLVNACGMAQCDLTVLFYLYTVCRIF